MSLKEIGVGIIGFGFMGKTHTYGYKTMPLYYDNLPFRIRLVGVCNRTMSIAEKAKEELGFEHATSDFNDLVNHPDIAVINVCTPNMFHKEHLIAAVKKGKHVYCDKPLGSSLVHAKEIVDAVTSHPVINQVAFQYRYLTATMHARELIEQGALGRILSFRACYLHSGSVDPDKLIGWKQDAAQGGGGVLYDLGSHVIDLLYHFLGEFESVCGASFVAYARRPSKAGGIIPITAEDSVHLIAKMKNGATGTIEASKIATGAVDELRFEIHGDKGALRFNLMQPNYLEYFDNAVPEIPLGGRRGFTAIECVQRYPKPGGSFPSPKNSIGWLRGHVHSLYEFVNCVYEGRKASPSFSDGFYVQQVMEKAYQSITERKWIAV